MKLFVFFWLLYFAIGQVQNENLPAFIAVGRNTTIEKYPYHLAVLKDGAHLCCASIISSSWALTAAHCFRQNAVPFTLQQITVRAGSSIYNSGGQVYPVKYIKIHPEYKSPRWGFDIALVKITGLFDIGNTQGIISLPKLRERVADGTNADLTGWGRMAYNGSWNPILQEVSLRTVSQEACMETHGDIGGVNRDTIMCAEYYEECREWWCQGNSGGPLVINGKQFGIVSWGLEASRPGWPAVFTRVASFRNWITNNIVERFHVEE